jgi:hypothetical protein
MNKRSVHEIIRTLITQQPTSRSGLVRSLLPEIEAALQSGHTIKTVWERVHQQDQAFSYKLFCLYLQRLRARGLKATAPTVGEKKAVLGKAEAGKEGKADFDPLKNLKQVEANRPGFQYQGTEDLQELIHGRKDHHAEQKRRNR